MVSESLFPPQSSSEVQPLETQFLAIQPASSQPSELSGSPEASLVASSVESTTLLEASEAKASRSVVTDRTALKVFFSTFLTIFLAELGDKTQVTTLLMTAESHSPWIVFAGAGTALVITSLIGVWLGCWLAKRVSAKTLETAAGILLLLISAQLFWEIFHL
jgi:Ca2+/H+ antiporter, TMEM165/GDT1 family